MRVNDQKFNAQCGNPFFDTKQQKRDGQVKLDEKLIRVADATRDLCRALKNVDDMQRQQAVAVCLSVAAEEYIMDKPVG